MDILDSKKLTQALKNIFKSELNFLNERRSLAEKIIEKNRLFYNDIEQEKTDAKKFITSEWKVGNISKDEGRKRMSEIKESYDLKKENLNNSKNNSLFEEYKKKYKQPLEINGFKNKMSFLSDETSYIEDIEYEKNYMLNSFKVIFAFDYPISEQKIKSVSLQAIGPNDRFMSIHVNIGENKEFDIQEISVFDEKEKFRFSKYDLNPKGISVLPTIKEDDLLDLDSSEREDLLLMLHDCSINLSEVPLYKIFKEGLKDFEKEIEKALSVKKKISNKI